MNGKTCVVTGANSGIGFETAKGLARMGARIIMVARDPARGEVAREAVQQASDSPIELFLADLSSVSETRELVDRIGNSCERVDVLINNAGVAYGSRTVTPEGNDATFAVNLLAPFVLSVGLRPVLERSAPARIVNVSSPAHKAGRIDLGNLQLESGFSRMKAYANSKLGLNLLTFELARRLEGTGVTCNAVNPGFVNTQPSYATRGEILVGKLMSPFGKSVANGAIPSIYAASAPDLATDTGKYIDPKLRFADASRESHDKELAGRLWDELQEIATR
jgi:NAD(P)-dependent dehydrogenase (short-subunit alcohol dehydrogenase family)